MNISGRCLLRLYLLSALALLSAVSTRAAAATPAACRTAATRSAGPPTTITTELGLGTAVGLDIVQAYHQCASDETLARTAVESLSNQ